MIRCVDAEAYEVKKEDISNGIFINFLKRRVCEDEKVTVMLDRVAEGMLSVTATCTSIIGIFRFLSTNAIMIFTILPCYRHGPVQNYTWEASFRTTE